MNVFGTLSQSMLWEFLYIFRTFYYVCMTKLRPGARRSRAPLRAPVAAYQNLLVSSNITNYCVGNDSSYSSPVLCFGQLSRLYALAFEISLIITDII